MRIIHWIASVSVLSAVLMWPHASTTAQTADLHDLDAFIARALKEYQVPGAAIAVVQDGNVVVAKGYGVRDMTKPSAVDENTIFQLASVTKSLGAPQPQAWWMKASWIGTHPFFITCPHSSATIRT